LVEHAPPFYLRADDLVKILRTIRYHLKGATLQDTEFTIHLTVANSKVLVIMVECRVKDLNRVEEHDPWLEILSRLRKHADPLVRYQVGYAYRALQLLPDDENLIWGLTRNTIDLVEGLLKEPAVIQLDFSGIPEAARTIALSGRELNNYPKKYFGSGDKDPWFLAVREADVMVREARLVDFNLWICEVDCRKDPFFQWGICLILGEMAIDPSWDATPREQAIELLGEIFKSNLGSDKHQPVRRWILTLLRDIPTPPRIWPSVDTSADDAIKKQALELTLRFEVLEDVRERSWSNTQQ